MSAMIGRSAGRTRRRRSSTTRPTANGEHPALHLAGYAGILQADAYAGFGDLYDAQRRPGPIGTALRLGIERAWCRPASIGLEARSRKTGARCAAVTEHFAMLAKWFGSDQCWGALAA
jgi:hypothetical protein